MKDVCKLLDKCDDDCPNTHYQKVVHIHDESPNSEIVHYNSPMMPLETTTMLITCIVVTLPI